MKRIFIGFHVVLIILYNEEKMMPKISVIIPVYNTEKYLSQCLDSVLAQTFDDFEVICVNDGSPDRCGEILADYAGKDKRIKVITQENQGVSAARNHALKNASGEYIVFLDADDLLAPCFLRKMATVLEQNPEAQMVWCNSVESEEIPSFNNCNKPCKAEVYESPFAHYFLRHKPCIVSSVWAKIFKKEVLDGLEFPEDQTCGEDLVVLYQALYRMHQAAFIAEDLFFYRIRPGSAMHTELTAQRLGSELATTEKLEKIFADKEMSTPVRKAFEYFIARRFFNMVFKLPKKKDKKQYRKWRKNYLPVLLRLERDGIFNPQHLELKKRIQYWWMKRKIETDL
jgi:glycosyltransferase involved in cell wall biosynthesis